MIMLNNIVKVLMKHHRSYVDMIYIPFLSHDKKYLT